MLRVGDAFGKTHSAFKFLNRFAFDVPGHFDKVNLLDTVTWVSELIRELAIVRQ
jgi:hypothetical protein